MSNITHTSVKAYRQAILDGRARTQIERVKIALRSVGPLTRWEIHKITGIRYASVCGRVNTLIVSGIARDDLEERANPDGGGRARVVQLVDPEPHQITFDHFAARLKEADRHALT